MRVLQKPSVNAPMRYPSVDQDWDFGRGRAHGSKHGQVHGQEKRHESSVVELPAIQEESESGSLETGDIGTKAEGVISRRDGHIVSSVEKENEKENGGQEQRSNSDSSPDTSNGEGDRLLEQRNGNDKGRDIIASVENQGQKIGSPKLCRADSGSEVRGQGQAHEKNSATTTAAHRTITRIASSEESQSVDENGNEKKQFSSTDDEGDVVNESEVGDTDESEVNGKGQDDMLHNERMHEEPGQQEQQQGQEKQKGQKELGDHQEHEEHGEHREHHDHQEQEEQEEQEDADGDITMTTKDHAPPPATTTEPSHNESISDNTSAVNETVKETQTQENTEDTRKRKKNSPESHVSKKQLRLETGNAPGRTSSPIPVPTPTPDEHVEDVVRCSQGIHENDDGGGSDSQQRDTARPSTHGKQTPAQPEQEYSGSGREKTQSKSPTNRHSTAASALKLLDEATKSNVATPPGSQRHRVTRPSPSQPTPTRLEVPASQLSNAQKSIQDSNFVASHVAAPHTEQNDKSNSPDVQLGAELNSSQNDKDSRKPRSSRAKQRAAEDLRRCENLKQRVNLLKAQGVSDVHLNDLQNWYELWVEIMKCRRQKQRASTEHIKNKLEPEVKSLRSKVADYEKKMNLPSTEDCIAGLANAGDGTGEGAVTAAVMDKQTSKDVIQNKPIAKGKKSAGVNNEMTSLSQDAKQPTEPEQKSKPNSNHVGPSLLPLPNSQRLSASPTVRRVPATKPKVTMPRGIREDTEAQLSFSDDNLPPAKNNIRPPVGPPKARDTGEGQERRLSASERRKKEEKKGGEGEAEEREDDDDDDESESEGDSENESESESESESDDNTTKPKAKNKIDQRRQQPPTKKPQNPPHPTPTKPRQDVKNSNNNKSNADNNTRPRASLKSMIAEQRKKAAEKAERNKAAAAAANNKTSSISARRDPQKKQRKNIFDLEASSEESTSSSGSSD